MGLELEIEDTDYESDWCDDVWNIGCPRIVEKTKRNVTQIINLANDLIDECTDVSPPIWIYLYLDKFKKIMEEDSSLTKFQVKHKLYLW